MERIEQVLQLLTGSPDRRIAGSPDRWIAGSLDRWIAGSLDRWIAGSLDRWIAGSLDRWIAGSLDRFGTEQPSSHFTAMWQYRIAMKAIPQFVLCMLLATCPAAEAVAKGASPATNGPVASINDHFQYHATGRSIPVLIAPIDTPDVYHYWMAEADTLLQYGIHAYPADPTAPFTCRWAGLRPEAPSPSMVCPCPECSARRQCQYSLPACPCSACSTPCHTACRQAVRQHELERLLEILIRNLPDDAPPPDQVERPDRPAGHNEKAPGATNTGGQSSILTP